MWCSYSDVCEVVYIVVYGAIYSASDVRKRVDAWSVDILWEFGLNFSHVCSAVYSAVYSAVCSAVTAYCMHGK